VGIDLVRDGRPTCTERRGCELAGFGDTHNDLRSAASLLSGVEIRALTQAASSTFILKGRPCLISSRRTTPFWMRSKCLNSSM